MNATFFRVEDREGRGPYSLRASHFYLSSDIHKAPHETGIHFTYGKDYFGFDTLEKFFKWFGSSLAACKALAENDYFLSFYNIDKSLINIDECQAVAPIKNCKPVKQIKFARIVKFIEKRLAA